MVCTLDTCDVYTSLYGYRPNLTANAFFLGALALCLLGCIVIAVTTRRYLGFSFLVALAYISEIVAYSERILSWQDPWRVPEYSLATLFSTIGPVFATMSIPILISNTIRILGAEHSPLSVRLYPRIFMGLDIAALAIQGMGLTITYADSSPLAQNLGRQGPNAGKYVVATGLVIQLLALLGEHILLLIVGVRASVASRRHGYTAFHPEEGYLRLRTRFRVFLITLPLTSACLFLRGVYQLVVYLEGLEGSLAKNEVYFIVANGVLVTEALAALVVFHPSLWLNQRIRAPTIKIDSADEVTRAIERAQENERIRRNGEVRNVGANLDEVNTLLMAHRRIASIGSISAMSDDSLDAARTGSSGAPRLPEVSPDTMSLPIAFEVSPETPRASDDISWRPTLSDGRAY